MGNGVQLRLALAMRGGVSLAVWIGGAVAEIDLVRRADPEARTGEDRPLRENHDAAGQSFWDQLLGISGYDDVVVDVLAGASAGGLNGVLFAASQVYDFDYDEMRQIWVDVGDVAHLVRRRGPWPSLFQGDEYFFKKVHESLSTLVGTATPPEPPQVSLDLTATLMEPISRPVRSPADEQLRDRRHGTGFRFRHPSESWLASSFPRVNDGADLATVDAALRRLALAARTTSSYPGAFEAAQVASGRRDTFGGDPLPSGPSATVDLDGNFLDRGATVPFIAADGGILDNIPIQRALDAVVRTASDRPSERFLVYLQPGAPAQPKAARSLAMDARTSTLGVLKGTVAARVAGENINEDIANIEDHNAGIGRAAALRRHAYQDVGSTVSLSEKAELARGGYAQARAMDDARRIGSLLEDPLGALGYDPFPRSLCDQLVDDDDWRSPLRGWTTVERQGLVAQLEVSIVAALENRPATEAVVAIADPQPLRRVALLALEWVRYLEHGARDVADPALHAGLGRLKRRIYRVYTFIDEVLVPAVQQAWVASAVVYSRGEDLVAQELVDRVLRALPSLLRCEESRAGEIAGALAEDPTSDGGAPPGNALLRLRTHDIYRRIPEVAQRVAGAEVSATDGVDLLRTVEKVLLAAMRSIHDLTETFPIDVSQEDPGRELAQALQKEVADGTPGWLEVLSHVEFVAGHPTQRPVYFHRCASSNRTPIAPDLVALAADGLGDDGMHISVDRKLAGNELANFSAFLLPEWRMNDWLWGRLDCVVTMIDLLLLPTHIRAWLVRRHQDQTTAGVPWDPAEELRAAIASCPSDPAWGHAVGSHVWTAAASTATAALMAADTDDDVRLVDVTAIRNAFIARRQWDILRREATPCGASPWSFDDVRAWAAEYKTGTETIKTLDRRTTLVPKLMALADVTPRVLLWNLGQDGSPWKPKPAIRRVVGYVGGKAAAVAVPRAIGSPHGSPFKKELRVVGVAALVWALLVAFSVGRWGLPPMLGALLGAVPLVGGLGVVGWMMWKRANDVLDEMQDAPDPLD